MAGPLITEVPHVYVTSLANIAAVTANQTLRWGALFSRALDAVYSGTSGNQHLVKMQIPVERTARQRTLSYDGQNPDGLVVTTGVTMREILISPDTEVYDSANMQGGVLQFPPLGDLMNYFNTNFLPSSQAVARGVDDKLGNAYKQVNQWVLSPNALSALTWPDFVAVRSQAFDYGMVDELQPLRGVFSGTLYYKLLEFDEMTSADKRGDGTDVLSTGVLSPQLNIELWPNNRKITHTVGTWYSGTVTVDGAVSAGGNTMTIAGAGATATINEGDLFSVAGDSGQYVVTDTFTADGAGAAIITFSPPVVDEFLDTAGVTVVNSHTVNLVFTPDRSFVWTAVTVDNWLATANMLGANVPYAIVPPSEGAAMPLLFYFSPDLERHGVKYFLGTLPVVLLQSKSQALRWIVPNS